MGGGRQGGLQQQVLGDLQENFCTFGRSLSHAPFAKSVDGCDEDANAGGSTSLGGYKLVPVRCVSGGNSAGSNIALGRSLQQ